MNQMVKLVEYCVGGGSIKLLSRAHVLLRRHTQHSITNGIGSMVRLVWMANERLTQRLASFQIRIVVLYLLARMDQVHLDGVYVKNKQRIKLRNQMYNTQVMFIRKLVECIIYLLCITQT